MNANEWLLVVEYKDGTRGYMNLWQAIEERRIVVRVNPLIHAKAVDICADVPENRHDIDTNFGIKTVVE